MAPVPVTIGRRAVPPSPASTPPSVSSSPPHQPQLLALDAGEQYRFGFSMVACIGCHSCEVACGEQNGLPAGTVWRRVGELEAGEHPTAQRFHLSMSCNHCLEPACLEGCPTNAYTKLANGVVAHNAADCVGCQYCTWNCPYSVPVFQPDRRIVTKCDLCQPRLGAGLAPACVDACPTHAITIEKVTIAEWRADPGTGDAPALPSVRHTLSTTRIELPADLGADALAASDWNIRPEHPHWSLVWLTLLSQLAVGTSFAAASLGERIASAVVAGLALIGALFHLGRPAVAYKALRNLRRSWLSREVALLSAFGMLAPTAAVFPALRPAASVVGVAGVYASARLYLVPGRPAWNTPLTVVRFGASTVALGMTVTGQRPFVAVALGVALAATATNWLRLARRPDPAWRGAVQLETRWFRTATALRWASAAAAMAGCLAGLTLWGVLALVVLSEGLGRWLFYVCVVPLNMPGAFWRGAAGSHR